MKRWLVPALVAVVILAIGVFGAVSSKDSSDDSDGTKNSASHGKKHAEDRGGRVKAGKQGKGDGPPSWAHSKNDKPDKAAREEWRQLSPAQRRALIDRLITQHAEGMKEWRECVRAGGDYCEKPFPPGLAKRR